MKKVTPFQVDFEEFLKTLPRPTQLEDRETPKRYNSCFVGVLGFEPRCFSAAKYLADIGWRTNRAICTHYGQEEMREINERYKDEMYASLKDLKGGADITPIEHDDHDLQSDFGDKLLRTLSAEGLDVNSSESQVLFDITVGSSRLLIEGLHALFNSGVSLTLVYSEATDYRPSFEEYQMYLEGSRDKKIPPPEFLTSGVEKVELLKCIPGHNADSRPTYLIAFPSFNATRMGAVFEELAPSRIFWLFGMPHLVKNRWRMDAQHDYHAGFIGRHHRHCYVSTFDYTETLCVLESIYEKIKYDYYMLVCSLGSKLQKVGQVIFHILHPDVGTVVSVPKRYDPERYSDEKPRAIYSIQLGDCRKLREQLWLTRTLRL